MSKFHKICNTISSDGEVVQSKKKAFYNPFKDGVGYNLKYKSCRCIIYTSIELPDEVSRIEKGLLLDLTKRIYSNTNLVAHRVGHRIKPYTKSEIKEITGWGQTRFSQFWNKMLKLHILKLIKIDDEKFYCFNPLYFNSTMYMPLYLFIAFQDELAQELPQWVLERYLNMAEDNDGRDEYLINDEEDV